MCDVTLPLELRFASGTVMRDVGVHLCELGMWKFKASFEGKVDLSLVIGIVSLILGAIAVFK